jgi:hypothetical protein
VPAREENDALANKAALPGITIAVVSEVAKRYRGFGALMLRQGM